MDKTIKFRAFDSRPGKRCMIYGIERGSDLRSQSFGEYLDYPNTYEVMQFTGWKDDNNKEIYEGDILRWDCAATLEEPAETAIYVVQWSDEDLRYELYDPFNGFRLEMGDTKFDIVVGNIWENPNMISCED